jgi:hypothetical protein
LGAALLAGQYLRGTQHGKSNMHHNPSKCLPISPMVITTMPHSRSSLTYRSHHNALPLRWRCLVDKSILQHTAHCTLTSSAHWRPQTRLPGMCTGCHLPGSTTTDHRVLSINNEHTHPAPHLTHICTHQHRTQTTHMHIPESHGAVQGVWAVRVELDTPPSV